MKKASAKKTNDDLRSEYDLSQLKGGVRGKYYQEASAATNLVLIDPDLSNVFPDTESVNRALRLLADTAESAASSKGHRSAVAKKRIKRSACTARERTTCERPAARCAEGLGTNTTFSYSKSYHPDSVSLSTRSDPRRYR
jgi:hypothetical protein